MNIYPPPQSASPRCLPLGVVPSSSRHPRAVNYDRALIANGKSRENLRHASRRTSGGK